VPILNNSLYIVIRFKFSSIEVLTINANNLPAMSLFCYHKAQNSQDVFNIKAGHLNPVYKFLFGLFLLDI